MTTMLNQMGIYLVQPQGRSLRPLDLDPRRIQKVAKVNNQFLKFGKSERPLSVRYQEYQKIFGPNVKFRCIIPFTDVSKMIEFRDHLSQRLDAYKISNPGSTRKLEWFTGISFSQAEKIIRDEYEFNFGEYTGIQSLIASLPVGQFTKLYKLPMSDLLQFAHQPSKMVGRPKGSIDVLGQEVQENIQIMASYLQSKNPSHSKRQLTEEIYRIFHSYSEEQLGNEVLIRIRRLSRERLRKLL